MQDKHTEDDNLVTTDSIPVDKNADMDIDDQISANSLRLDHGKSDDGIAAADKTPGFQSINSKSNSP